MTRFGDVRSFNEAAPLRKRKGRVSRLTWRTVRRFNEAAPLRKRKARWPLLRWLFGNAASMRPLPYGSGKVSWIQCVRAYCGLQ